MKQHELYIVGFIGDWSHGSEKESSAQQFLAEHPRALTYIWLQIFEMFKKKIRLNIFKTKNCLYWYIRTRGATPADLDPKTSTKRPFTTTTHPVRHAPQRAAPPLCLALVDDGANTAHISIVRLWIFCRWVRCACPRIRELTYHRYSSRRLSSR